MLQTELRGYAEFESRIGRRRSVGNHSSAHLGRTSAAERSPRQGRTTSIGATSAARAERLPGPLRRENLARIEQVPGSKARLDPAHQVERRRPVLVLHVGDLLLARSRARRCRCPPWRWRGGRGGRRRLRRPRSRWRRPCRSSGLTWKLPSPTWPTIGATRPVAAMSASVSSRTRQGGDRHAGVGGEGAGAGAQGHLGRKTPRGALSRAWSAPPVWSPR